MKFKNLTHITYILPMTIDRISTGTITLGRVLFPYHVGIRVETGPQYTSFVVQGDKIGQYV